MNQLINNGEIMNYIIKVICALLLISTSAYAAEFSDGPRARNVLTSQVKKLFENGNYAELDRMADQFRKNKSRFPDGVWKLYIFYTGFEMSPYVPEPYFPGAIDMASSWRKTNPKSVTAQCVLASLWADYAWKARGGGYASEIKDQSKPLMRERLEKAWKIINEPLASGVADCPKRHDLRLVLAKARGVENKQFEVMYKEALKQAPDYYQLYSTIADYLLPKWHGHVGEWQQFITKVADQNPKREGATIYTRTVWSMFLGNDLQKFEGSGISWPRMKEGFEEIDRNYPNSSWILNNTAKFACRAGDKETLRSKMKRIDRNNYYPEAWKDENIDTCRKLIGLLPIPEH
jgi:hypothetical protein